MPDRALIIAVEDYPHVTDGFTAAKLAGTLDAALKFRAWLTSKWQAEGIQGHIYFCSEPRVEGGTGADRDSIIDALLKIQGEGRDKTDNLFVYFSGHGFRLKGETSKLADALVTSDFKDIKRSASSCFKLDALVDGLRMALGRGSHFYFIDSCRNEVPKAVGTSIMPFDEQGSEDPSVFVLQSTVAGAPSLVAGPFASSLLAGLQGTGRAKVWVPPTSDSMRVRFDSLRLYLKSILQKTQPITHTVTGEMGETEAMLAIIKPVSPKKLAVTLKAGMTSVTGNIEITSFKGGNPAIHSVTLGQTVIELQPDDYKIKLVLQNAIASPADSQDVGLYEDAEILFTALPPQVALEGIDRNYEGVFGFIRRPDPTISKAVIRGGAPQAETDEPSPSAARESIQSLLPKAGSGIDFSESLHGAVQDPDLAIWLAILGGGRILGGHGDYSKIDGLGLHDFTDEPPEASPVYVLAGFNGEETRLRVGHGPDAQPTKWVTAASHSQMPGVFEIVLHPKPGQFYLTLAVDDQPAYTLTSCAMPNRCTLIVLTLGEEGQPHVSQYLLPIGHLVHRLDMDIQHILQGRNQLKDVQVLALLARAFRKRRKLVDALDANTETNLHHVKAEEQLDMLLSSKWLDPIGACLAMYECVRRRKLESLQTVADNMIRYFHEFPDTRAIAALANKPDEFPGDRVPLFLQGLKALPPESVVLPFSSDLLDYSGPWTAWRGAVEIPT